jgi:hypothetical protein
LDGIGKTTNAIRGGKPLDCVRLAGTVQVGASAYSTTVQCHNGLAIPTPSLIFAGRRANNLPLFESYFGAGLINAGEDNGVAVDTGYRLPLSSLCIRLVGW